MDAVNEMLRAVLLNPHDDTAKLVYADALQERGKGDDEAWAVTIRYAVKWFGSGWDTLYTVRRTEEPDFEQKALDSVKVLRDKVWFSTGTTDYFPFKPWAHWYMGFIDTVHCESLKEWEELKHHLYWAGPPWDCPPTAQPINKVTMPTAEWGTIGLHEIQEVASRSPGVKFSAGGSWVRFPTAAEEKGNRVVEIEYLPA